MKQRRSFLVILLMFPALFGVCLAQPFPNKPIRLITGNSPGTVIDGSARMIGVELEKSLGQPVVIEFKTGANGTIAAQAVKSAPADGYTLYLGSAPQVHPLLNANNGVDAAKEYTSVSLLVKAPYFLFARSNLPFTSVAELAAYSKANPQTLKFGAASQLQELVMEVIKNKTGIAISQNIPYRGSPPVVTAMLANDVDLATSSAPPFLPHVQTGKLRALLIASDKRMPDLPQVPTGFEVGMPVELGLYVGLWAPAGTPAAVVRKLSSAFAAATKLPAIADQLRKTFGAEPIGSTPEEQSRFFESDMKVWSDAAAATNFKPQ